MSASDRPATKPATLDALYGESAPMWTLPIT